MSAQDNNLYFDMRRVGVLLSSISICFFHLSCVSTNHKDEYKPYFDHIMLKESGIPQMPLNCNPEKVTMVDAARVINKNHKGTGGGAHSDIYDVEIGRFVWETIKTCAK
jgi:hypothetical protein